MKKRVLSMFMVLALCLSLLPAPACPGMLWWSVSAKHTVSKR